MGKARICCIPGCGKPHDSKGYCKTHYLRMRRHGDPLKTVNGKGVEYLLNVVMNYDGEDCLPWPFGRTGKGRGQIRYNGRDWYVHRLVCILAHGEPPTPDHLATHRCGNGHLGCVNKHHLVWGTHGDNRTDVSLHAELPDRNTLSVKLSREKVRQIRTLRGKLSVKAIAKQFGVSHATISDIFAGRTWSWLKD